MKKIILSFLTLALIAVSVSAQKLDDGIKALYYEKYKTAKTILEKLGGNNSKRADAVYWYGQALIQDKGDPNGVTKAKALYQDALNRGLNDPYIIVGLGQIDLINGNDVAAAKQKFDQAIAASTKKGNPDPDILNAVGRANAAGSASTGDPAYAIELLKKAAQLDTQNPDIDLNLGLNYLKLGGENGGAAVEAFQDATARDAKYAKGYYEIGRIYGSQGNYDIMNEWFAKALTADDSYGPLYYGWYETAKAQNDLAGAEDYLKKYAERSDNDGNTQYYLADFLFRAKKYDEALAKTQELATNNPEYTYTNSLLAHIYDAQGKTQDAKTAISKFIGSTPANLISADDYALAGKLYKDEPDSVAVYYAKAFEADTSIYDKVDHADSLIHIFTRLNKPVETYQWTKNRFYLIPSKYINNVELYNLGEAARIAAPLTKSPADFALADSAFKEYKTKYPEEVYGYNGRALNAIAADTTFKQAFEPVSEYITFLEKDKATNKERLVYFYDILGQYYANTAGDYDHATDEYKKVIALDPSNERATQIIAQIAKIKAQKAAAVPDSTANANGN